MNQGQFYDYATTLETWMRPDECHVYVAFEFLLSDRGGDSTPRSRTAGYRSSVGEYPSRRVCYKAAELPALWWAQAAHLCTLLDRLAFFFRGSLYRLAIDIGPIQPFWLPTHHISAAGAAADRINAFCNQILTSWTTVVYCDRSHLLQAIL